MASRPIFVSKPKGVIGVEEVMVDFKWFAGLARSQKQKSIDALHKSGNDRGINPILEISSKSRQPLGNELSAFNLIIKTKLKANMFTVESAFQGSKVFERGGPYKDLIGMNSKAAKKDLRIKDSGNLIGFEFFGEKFPLIPRTYFYDWVYINALYQNKELSEIVKTYSGFTDIEFNPSKSINCQAYSAALYNSLCKNLVLDKALSSPAEFLNLTKAQYERQRRNVAVQQKF